MASAPVRRAASTIASIRRYDSAEVAPPSATASSASRANGDLRSGSEKTATVEMPSSRQVRNTRRAISPRLATRTFRIVFTRGPGAFAPMTRLHPEDAEARRARNLRGVDGGEGESEHGAGVAGVHDPVVPQPGGGVEGERLALDLLLHHLPHRGVALLVE